VECHSNFVTDRKKLDVLQCTRYYIHDIHVCTHIDQFSNLEVIAGRILGCYEHGPTFFVREILDGIAAQPGGDYIHGGYRHRQALPQSRLKYHGLPGPPLVRADHES
jgi:hypothetical protein